MVPVSFLLPIMEQKEISGLMLVVVMNTLGRIF